MSKIFQTQFQEILKRVRENDVKLKKIDLKEIILDSSMLNEFEVAFHENAEVGNIVWGNIPSDQKSKDIVVRIEKKIIQNNIDYRYYPSDYIHGLFSSHVYNNIEIDAPITVIIGNRTENLIDWKVNKIFLDKESGYYSAIYINDKKHYLVLAHRGTTFEWEDLSKEDSPAVTDLKGILGDKIVAQQAYAFSATNYTIDLARETGYSFSTTGHSLGAWLAELSTYFANKDLGYREAKVITFDSPGSGDTYEMFKSNIINYETEFNTKNLDITTYLSIPNIVNTCNKHVGRVYHIHPHFNSPEISGLLQSIAEHTNNVEYLKVFQAVFSHMLDSILQTFDPETGIPSHYSKVFDWPYLERTDKNKNLIDFLPSNYNIAAKTLGYLGKDQALMNIIFLFNDLIMGNVDASQYLAFLEKTSSPTFDVRDDLNDYEVFFLKYFAHYDVKKETHLEALPNLSRKDSLDSYLLDLKHYGLGITELNLLESNVLNLQIKEFISGYEIDEYSIRSKDNNIDKLRDFVKRIISVAPELRKTLNIASKQFIETGAIVSFASNLPGRVNYFIERVESSQIEEYLKEKNIAFVSGLGGVGKSGLVTEYCYHQLNQGKSIRWFEADSVEKLEQQFRKFAEVLEISTDSRTPQDIKEDLVKRLIKVKDKEFIFIFNDIDDKGVWLIVKDYIAGLPNNFKFILTTRDSNLAQEHNHINLNEFTKEQARSYLGEALKRRKITEEEVENIIKVVSLLPYRLNKVVGYLQEEKLVSVTQYLEKYRGVRATNKANYGIEPESELLFRNLNEKCKGGVEILKYVMYLEPSSIPVELLKRLYSRNEENFSKDLSTLGALSLIEVMPRGDDIKIHKISQNESSMYLQGIYSDNDTWKEEVFLKVVLGIITNFPIVSNVPDNTWDQARYYISHIKELLKHVEQFNTPLDVLTAINSRLGHYYLNIEIDYRVSAEYFKKALITQKIIYENTNHFDIAITLNNIGANYMRVGNYQEALEYLEEALTIQKMLHGNMNSHNTAITLNNIGLCYEGMGNHSKALEYLEEALTMRNEMSEVFGIVTCLNNIATIYSDTGNYREAIDRHEAVLTIQKSIYGNKSYPNIATTLNNLGMNYNMIGDYKKALECFEKALIMYRELFENAKHPDIATSLNNLGMNYNSIGNHQKALEYIEEALEMQKELYNNKDHSDIATSLNNMGTIYSDIGDHKKALEYLEDALAMRILLHAEVSHYDVAISLNNVAINYNSVGNHQKALEYLEKALAMWKELYGNGAHPNIAATLNNFGTVYKDSSLYPEALEYFNKALVMLRELYGAMNHPDIAASLSNIGKIYQSIDNYQKAFEYYYEALTIRKTLKYTNIDILLNNIGKISDIGEIYENTGDLQQALICYKKVLAELQELDKTGRHPYIVNALNNIGRVYQSLGEHKEALNYYNESLTMLKELHGTENHPDIAVLLSNIGGLYESLGNYKKALKYLEKAFFVVIHLDQDSAYPLINPLINSLEYLFASGRKIETEKLQIIHEAVKCSNFKFIKLTIDSISYLINNLDANNLTALHLASITGSLEISGLLLEKGAKQDLQDQFDLSPLDYALLLHHDSIANKLINYSNEDNKNNSVYDSLNIAVSIGNKDIVKAFTKTGIAIDNKDELLGWMPIDYARISGNHKLKNILDPTRKMVHHKTKLTLEAIYKVIDVFDHVVCDEELDLNIIALNFPILVGFGMSKEVEASGINYAISAQDVQKSKVGAAELVIRNIINAIQEEFKTKKDEMCQERYKSDCKKIKSFNDIEQCYSDKEHIYLVLSSTCGESMKNVGKTFEDFGHEWAICQSVVQNYHTEL